MNSPPPLPAMKIPPPLPKSGTPCPDAYRRYAIWASILAVFVFTGGAVKLLLNDAKPLDLKVFAICITLVTWIGLWGLIARRKKPAWGAYVTFGCLLIGFPLGTVLGIYGIKWMRVIYPTFR